MSNSLIVRDATLAINGVSPSGSNPEGHVRARIEEARGLDNGTVRDCADVLRASAGASGGDPDVLEALVVIALAHPTVGQEYEISPQVMGRRLAARLERTGEAARALAILRLLLDHFPGNDALEREMAALMRRQGMVQDLADRYLERAERLLEKGQEEEAVAWLREVLLLDRSRTDVARRIRDLKHSRQESQRVSRGRRRLLLGTTILAVCTAGVVQHETSVREDFKGLPQVRSGSHESVVQRLAGLEQFIHRHPVWHGALNALTERNELRQTVRLEEHRLQSESDAAGASSAESAESLSGNERADLARRRAYNLIYVVEETDFELALEQLELALACADDDWEWRERTLRDIDSIEKELKESTDQ